MSSLHIIIMIMITGLSSVGLVASAAKTLALLHTPHASLSSYSARHGTAHGTTHSASGTDLGYGTPRSSTRLVRKRHTSVGWHRCTRHSTGSSTGNRAGSRCVSQFRILATLPLLHLFFDFLVFVVVILSGIGNLVLEDLDELIEDHSNDSASCGANPVNPVLSVEDTSYDTRTEGASGIKRATSVVDTDKFSDEEGKTDTHGRNERRW